MDILHWKEITMPDNHLQPVVFFQPSLEFLTYLRNYGHLNIPLRISGTDFYDGIYVVNIDTKTDLVPCFHYLTPRVLVLSAVLDRDFTVIPPNRGKVELHQPSEERTAPSDPPVSSEMREGMTTPTLTPTPTPTPTTSSLQLWHIITILLIILAIMFSCFAWI